MIIETLKFRPVTPGRWPDLERLFGERGACGGCWCMAWRLRNKDWVAGKRGARIVEGYPVIPTMEKTPDPFIWTGVPSAFLKAGFREVARRSKTRPIMRRKI